MGRGDVCVVDLSFGDSGKGTTVDALAAQSSSPPLVVRYNSACQAAHNVVVGGLHHTFASYGSGTLAGSPTLVSHFTYVNPILMKRECNLLLHKTPGLPRIIIDPECPVLTAYHAVMNRAREVMRGGAHHGSTGHGVGEMSRLIESGGPVAVISDFTRKLDNAVHILTHLHAEMLALVDGNPDLQNLHPLQSLSPLDLAIKIQQSLRYVLNHGGRIECDLDVLADWRGSVIYEGAQGVLLDELYGFNPHTTWTDTTPTNAQALAIAADREDPFVLGVIRTYMTRHGAGPMPTEGSFRRDDAYNKEADYVGPFRSGALDLTLLRYANGVANCDGLSVTHLDVLPDRMSTAYADGWIPRQHQTLSESFLATYRLRTVKPVHEPFDIERVEQELAPIALKSYGPDRHDKEFTEFGQRLLA